MASTISNELAKDLRAALDALADKHGCGVEMESKRPGMITVTVFTANADALAQEEFAALARMRGIDPELYGQTFTVRSTTYRVIGVRPNARKNCLRIRVIGGQATEGKEFVCPPSFVTMHLRITGRQESLGVRTRTRP